jgi:hypothetical protein
MANGRQRSPHPIHWAEKLRGGQEDSGSRVLQLARAYQPGGGGPCCCQSQAHPRTKLFADKVSATVQFNVRNLTEGGRLQPRAER